MSAAAADAVEMPRKKGGKKLVLILAIVGLLLAVAGGAAVFVMKRNAAAAAAAEEEGDEPSSEHARARKKVAHVAPPTFLPLEAFVVNLADREQERYAQIGITLQVDDPQVAEQLKAYMPAIRNGVLMILAHKTSTELLDREGKLKLADEIMRESVRPLGIELDDEDVDETEARDARPATKKKKRKAPVHNPVEHVHFSSFIIQ
jgi:flagellar FliL protein